MEKDQSKVKGALARKESLSDAERSKIAKIAATKRWGHRATHESKIKIGDLEIECAVLEDGTRVISERAMTRAFGGKRGGSHWKRVKEAGTKLPVYLSAKNYLPFINEELVTALGETIKYRTLSGNLAYGLNANLLPEVCNIFLKTRDAQKLHPSQISLVMQADIIMRGLATVGIIALIDEATGYQKDRASDALSKILEAFIAKELQPWVKTFPDDYYEQLFRLKGVEYPSMSVKRPQYFGHITNNIVYKRLAPTVLEELKKSTPKNMKGRPRHHLHRRLTPDLGHPKLREYMSSLITVMKLSDDYKDFIKKLDKLHPKYNETLEMDFKDDEDKGI